MRIIKRVMVAIGAPYMLRLSSYIPLHLSPTRAHTHAPALFDIYTCVARTGRRDRSGAQLEIRGPLFVVLWYLGSRRVEPEDAVSGDRIYGLAASTWKEYVEKYIGHWSRNLVVIVQRYIGPLLYLHRPPDF